MAAIGGVLDGNGHPSVGSIFGQLDAGPSCNAQVIDGCQGVLIAPRVFVSTGDCIDLFGNAANYGYNLTAIWVSFSPGNPFDCSTAVRVQAFYINPFDETLHDPAGNVGVFIFETDAPVTPATLPTAGEVDGLPRDTDFTAVSYMGSNWPSDYQRRAFPNTLKVVDPDTFTLHESDRGCVDNLEAGGGFIGSTMEVAGIKLSGGHGCKAGEYLRLDTAIIRSFLANYVTLP